MSAVTFYREDSLPFLEAKRCMRSDLAYQKHFHMDDRVLNFVQDEQTT
ncbi:hypothetical protein AB4Z50_13460 [Paenibacillus sp. 2TAB26]